MEGPERTEPIRILRILPIGPFPRQLARLLTARISERVLVPCLLLPHYIDEIPMLEERRQVDADRLLGILEERQGDDGGLLVGLLRLDLGTTLFKFVFGRARVGGRAILASTARLAQEPYGLPGNEEIVARRLVTEVLHELGHAAGLIHCEDYSCLMRFAADVETIDIRGTDACERCRAEVDDLPIARPPLAPEYREPS